MKGSQLLPAAFREPPSGGPRKAEPEVCPQSRSQAQAVGLRGKNLIFRLKVTRVRHALKHQPSAASRFRLGSYLKHTFIRRFCADS